MTDMTLRRLQRLLLPQSLNKLEEPSRGEERHRRAILTGSVATFARIVQISSSLVTVPLTLKYLGNERFGLWMTISSVLAMAAFADFGIGNGVLNTVAKAFGKDDVEQVRRAASSGFALLSLIAVCLIAVFESIYRMIDWGSFFRVKSPQAISEAGPALAVFVICFALNISLDVVQRVQLGVQRGYFFSLWQLIGSTLGLLGVFAGIWFHVGLPTLVAAIAGAPLLATTFNAIHFFGFIRPDLRPSVSFVRPEMVLQIAKLGGFFFVLQLVIAFSYSADNFILARALGAVNVPEYSIPQRMFSLITMISGMLVAPLWPAYGEALSRGDISWVKNALNRSLLLVFVATALASCILLLLANQLIHWWVGPRIHPPLLLLVGLAVWVVIAATGDALGAFLNGCEVIRPQLVIAPVFAVGCLASKIYFVHRFGIVAMPWSTIAAYLMLNALPYAILMPILLRRMTPPCAVR